MNAIVSLVLAQGANGKGYGAVGDENDLADRISSYLKLSSGMENQVPAVTKVLSNYFTQTNVINARAMREAKITAQRNWTTYIQTDLNDQDALGRSLAEYQQYMQSLGQAPNTHGHHIINKKGAAWGTGKDESRDARDILLYYGINPYWDREKLVYAPNDGHPPAAIIYMDGELDTAFIEHKSKASIIEMLQDFARRFIAGSLPGQ
jgi:hypothetical protein